MDEILFLPRLSFLVLPCPSLSFLVLPCPSLSFLVLPCPSLSFCVLLCTQPANNSNPKPKKQPKTQSAMPQSRNLRHDKSRNLKICTENPLSNIYVLPETIFRLTLRFCSSFPFFFMQRQVSKHFLV